MLQSRIIQTLQIFNQGTFKLARVARWDNVNGDDNNGAPANTTYLEASSFMSESPLFLY